MDYDAIQPVYALSLVNVEFRPDTPEYYHRYLISDVADASQQIKGMEFVFVELPKFKPKNIGERKLQVLWLRFLTEIGEQTETVPEELTATEEIREALDCVERSAYTEAEMNAYDRFRDAVLSYRTLINDAKKESQLALDEAKAKLARQEAEITAKSAEIAALRKQLEKLQQNK
jgi:hypothetical protein